LRGLDRSAIFVVHGLVVDRQRVDFRLDLVTLRLRVRDQIRDTNNDKEQDELSDLMRGEIAFERLDGLEVTREGRLARVA